MPLPRRLFKKGTLLRTNLILHSAASMHTPKALKIMKHSYNMKKGENNKKNLTAVNAFKTMKSSDMAANPITMTLCEGTVTL